MGLQLGGAIGLKLSNDIEPSIYRSAILTKKYCIVLFTQKIVTEL